MKNFHNIPIKIDNEKQQIKLKGSILTHKFSYSLVIGKKRY